MGAGYDIGLSSSDSIAARSSAGAGDFTVGGGPALAKQSQTLLIVLAVVAVAVVFILFGRK
jgi:hypothetical protein